MEIDQSCLEERQREHVARMRVERIIELIAAALPELEMRAVAPATEVWAKDAAGLGLTVNIVNPGAGANTPRHGRGDAHNVPRRPRPTPLNLVGPTKASPHASMWMCPGFQTPF